MTWLLFTLIALATAALVARPLMSAGARAGGSEEVALYRAQLAELDRDLARGVIDPAEAEAARVEIARRLLAADGAVRAGAVARPAPVLAGVTALVVLAGGLGLYAWLGSPGAPDRPLALRLEEAEAARANRPSQAEAVAAAPPVPAPEAGQDYLDMVAQLREVVAGRPDDLEGHRLLMRHEAALGRYAAAAEAQAVVLRLRGPEATLAERVALADLMVAAAGGVVSPEAEAVVRAVLDEDPQEPGARYNLGLLHAQTGRPDLAFRLWRPVAEGGAEGALHTVLAREQVERAAEAAGIDYTLPDRPGPSAEQIAAAEDMDPEARAEMIRGMVAQLSDRLAEEGGPVADWARLIGALGVLGETERAAAILAEARDAFGAQPGALETLAAAARQAGLE